MHNISAEELFSGCGSFTPAFLFKLSKKSKIFKSLLFLHISQKIKEK